MDPLVVSEEWFPRVLSLETKLGTDLPDEPEVVSRVAQTIRKGLVGLKKPDHPMGRFLLIGRNGTGRKLATGLARFLFGDPRRTLWLSMANYAEKHYVSELVGPNAGMFGESSPGDLTGPLGQHPDMVIVMENIEKAHRDVAWLLIDAFAHGALVDWAGRPTPLSRSVFVFTTNVGYWGTVPSEDLIFEPNGRHVSERFRGRVRTAVQGQFPSEMLEGTFIDDILIELGPANTTSPEMASVEP